MENEINFYTSQVELFNELGDLKRANYYQSVLNGYLNF